MNAITQKIGVIGCGNMGGGMVSHLLKSGLNIHCSDPEPEAMTRMASLGAATATAQALAEKAQLIILSLPTAQIVSSVMRTISHHIQPGTVVLDTSTSVPATSQAWAAEGESCGFDFIDGPVSGGPAAAVSGNMTMLLAGDRNAIARIQAIIDILTAKAVYVGASGAGHAAKIANNMLCAANLVLVSEALRLGEASGVPPEFLLEGVNAGSGRSGVSEANYPKWILNDAFDSGFTMGLMRKDVGLAVELAANTDVALSGFSGIADIWLNRSGAIANDEDFNQITRFVPNS